MIKNIPLELMVGIENKTPQDRSGKFIGAQIGITNSTDTSHVYGLQLGMASAVESMTGFHLNIFMSLIMKGDLRGVQVSGLLNLADYAYGIQAAGVTNTALKVNGVQAGIFNYVKEEINGVQLGAFNAASEELNGLQVGLICYANKGNYLQLGLLTIRDGDRPWYTKVSPLIGWSTNAKE